eukprot:5226287-Pleurochrysis_carterae.AAC.3
MSGVQPTLLFSPSASLSVWAKVDSRMKVRLPRLTTTISQVAAYLVIPVTRSLKMTFEQEEWCN